MFCFNWSLPTTYATGYDFGTSQRKREKEVQNVLRKNLRQKRDLSAYYYGKGGVTVDDMDVKQRAYYPIRFSLELGGQIYDNSDFVGKGNVWIPLLKGTYYGLFADYDIKTNTDGILLEDNIGLVYRKLTKDKKKIWGAYAYYSRHDTNERFKNFDKLDSDLYTINEEKRVESIVMGMEILWEKFELRLNYYHPFSEKDEGLFNDGRFIVVMDDNNLLVNSGGCNGVVCRLTYDTLEIEAGLTWWKRASFYISYYISADRFLLKSSNRDLSFYLLDETGKKTDIEVPKYFSGVKARTEIPLMDDGKFSVKLLASFATDQLSSSNIYVGLQAQFLLGGDRRKLQGQLERVRNTYNTINQNSYRDVLDGISAKMNIPTVHSNNNAVSVLNIKKHDFSTHLKNSNGDFRKIYFAGGGSTPSGSGTGSEGSWNNPTTFDSALAMAKDEDIIYVFNDKTNANLQTVLNQTLHLDKNIQLQGTNGDFMLNDTPVYFAEGIDLLTNRDKYESVINIKHDSGAGIQLERDGITINGINFVNSVTDAGSTFIYAKNLTDVNIGSNIFTRTGQTQDGYTDINLEYDNAQQSRYNIKLQGNNTGKNQAKISLNTNIPESAQLNFNFGGANTILIFDGMNRSITVDLNDVFSVDGLKQFDLSNIKFTQNVNATQPLNWSMYLDNIGTLKMDNNSFTNIKMSLNNITTFQLNNNKFILDNYDPNNRSIIDLMYTKKYTESDINIDLGSNNIFQFNNFVPIQNDLVNDGNNDIKLLNINIQKTIDSIALNTGKNTYRLNNQDKINNQVNLINIQTSVLGDNTSISLSGKESVYLVENGSNATFDTNRAISAIKIHNTSGKNLKNLKLANLALQTQEYVNSISPGSGVNKFVNLGAGIDYGLYVSANSNINNNRLEGVINFKKDLIFVEDTTQLSIEQSEFGVTNKRILTFTGGNNLTFKEGNRLNAAVNNWPIADDTNGNPYNLVNYVHQIGSHNSATVNLGANNIFDINSTIAASYTLNIINIGLNSYNVTSADIQIGTNNFFNVDSTDINQIRMIHIDSQKNRNLETLNISGNSTANTTPNYYVASNNSSNVVAILADIHQNGLDTFNLSYFKESTLNNSVSPFFRGIDYILMVTETRDRYTNNAVGSQNIISGVDNIYFSTVEFQNSTDDVKTGQDIKSLMAIFGAKKIHFSGINTFNLDNTNTIDLSKKSIFHLASENDINFVLNEMAGTNDKTTFTLKYKSTVQDSTGLFTLENLKPTGSPNNTLNILTSGTSTPTGATKPVDDTKAVIEIHKDGVKQTPDLYFELDFKDDASKKILNVNGGKTDIKIGKPTTTK